MISHSHFVSKLRFPQDASVVAKQRPRHPECPAGETMCVELSSCLVPSCPGHSGLRCVLRASRWRACTAHIFSGSGDKQHFFFFLHLEITSAMVWTNCKISQATEIMTYHELVRFLIYIISRTIINLYDFLVLNCAFQLGIKKLFISGIMFSDGGIRENVNWRRANNLDLCIDCLLALSLPLLFLFLLSTAVGCMYNVHALVCWPAPGPSSSPP